MENGELRVSLPARFLSAGQCVAHEGWLHPHRTLDSNVLIVVEQGRFGIMVGGDRFIPAAGQALILPAGIEHLGVRVDGEVPPVYCWAHFVDAATPSAHQIALGCPVVGLDDVSHNRLANAFHQLINESASRQGDSLICDYMLSTLLLELYEGSREPQRAAVANRMLEYVRLHCYERLTLSDLSRTLGYSEDYLSRLFHESVRCPFRQYIHRLRLQRAKKELLSGGKTIQEIALECGYSNAKFFSTAFVRFEGVSPSSYRNLYGGLHQNTD